MESKINLTEDQLKIIKTVEEDIDNNTFINQKILLTGSAGTGKTTTLIELIKMLEEKTKKNIQVLTPTHQSSIVIHKILQGYNLKRTDIGTIHSYFDIKPDIDDNGNRVFKPSKSDPEIMHDIFIIDESSMIDSVLYGIITKYLAPYPVVFVGDEYQLPPVKEDFSPVFKYFEEQENLGNTKYIFKLEKIIRTQNKNSLIFEKFRELIKRFKEENYKAPLKDINNLINEFQTFSESQFPDFFNKYVEERFQNKKNIKIGTFTNNFTDYYNLHFRRFDNEVKNPDDIYSEGDKLLLNGPYNYWNLARDKTKLTSRDFMSVCNYLKNGEEIKVNEVIESTLEIKNLSALETAVISFNQDIPDFPNVKEIAKKGIKFEVFNIQGEVHNPNAPSRKSNKSIVIDKDGKAKEFLRKFLNFAKIYNFTNKGGHGRRITKKSKKELWKLYYTLSDYFAEVTYTYSSTIHKLQGQTLDEIFIDTRDFNHLYNTDYNLFLRLLYVGITRTSNDVFILK